MTGSHTLGMLADADPLLLPGDRSGHRHRLGRRGLLANQPLLVALLLPRQKLAHLLLVLVDVLQHLLPREVGATPTLTQAASSGHAR